MLYLIFSIIQFASSRGYNGNPAQISQQTRSLNPPGVGFIPVVTTEIDFIAREQYHQP